MEMIIAATASSLMTLGMIIGAFFSEKANAWFFEKEERALVDRPWHAACKTKVSWVGVVMISVIVPYTFIGLYQAHKKFRMEKIRTCSNGLKAMVSCGFILLGMCAWLSVALATIKREIEKGQSSSLRISVIVIIIAGGSLLIAAVYCLVRGALQYRAGKEMLRCLRAVNFLPEKKISLIAKDLDRSTEETVALLHKLIDYTYLPPDTEIDVENDRLKPGKPISKQLEREAKKMLRNK